MKRRIDRVAAPLVALGLTLAGCREEAPSPTGSEPLASSAAPSSPAAPGAGGMGMGSGGMQGMGMGRGFAGRQGMGQGFGGMQGMGGMGFGAGPGDGQGPGMGPGGGRPTEFPSWQLTPEAQAELEARRAALPPPNVPASAAELAIAASTRPGRCVEHQRTHLYVLRGDALLRSQTVQEALGSEDAVEVATRRGPVQRTLPLLTLVPSDATTGEVLVYPCVGEPFRVSVEALRAAPTRYALVENRKGLLKLIDATPPEGQHRRLLKNIAAIVVP